MAIISALQINSTQKDASLFTLPTRILECSKAANSVNNGRI